LRTPPATLSRDREIAAPPAGKRYRGPGARAGSEIEPSAE